MPKISKNLCYNSVTFADVNTSVSGGVTVREENQAAVQLLSAAAEVLESQAIGYKMSFRSMGGTPLEAISNIAPGSQVSAPAAPERAGYIFAGWYADEAYTAPWSFASAVDADMTLFANWNPLDEGGPGSVPLQSVSLDRTALTLTVGATGTLNVSYSPADTTDSKTVNWTSSAPNVATVTGGVVTAVSAGTATVTATVGDKTASCLVTVTRSGGTGGGGGGGGTPPVDPDPVSSVTAVTPGTPGVTVSKATLTHISGLNRVETSVAISRQGWTSAETVILAPGGQNNLIDALAVAPLAGQEKAPILLSTGSLDPGVVAEIQRLGAKKIYAVGAISSAVIDALKAALPGVTVEVLKGSNRFETAALINAKLTAPQGTFVVGYNAIADAVSAASFAAANGYAIQIAGPDGSVSAAPTGTAYVLGGPTLVNEVAGATRLYGATRYETNRAIRDALTFEYTNIYTADGNTLVDALTGSALAAQTKAAVVLLPGNDPTGADFGKITTETKVYAFGG
ncbi:MAG: cell wall-binding repeat-containing protein [Gracilibacteraceae bacterium]|nr:cell wall-binding repeat-containing protein [Gracilibacteraceae bacterium]